MSSILALAASYFIGAIPFGLIVGKVSKGIDIRDFGSGNIGASNVLRTLGPVLGVLVLLLDTAKGLAAVLICKALGLTPWFIVLGALMGVAGHTLSVFLKFRGGKGVATSLGVIIGLDPAAAGIAFGLWLIIVAVTRYISLASIIATITVPILFRWVWAKPLAYQVLVIVASLAILVKHRSNMVRLIRGVETRIGEKVDISSGGEESPHE